MKMLYDDLKLLDKILLKMSAPLRICYRKPKCCMFYMFWEFPNISDAVDFVRELAEWELQKEYSREYISRSILKRSDNWINVLDHLGLNILPNIRCNLCELEIFSYEHSFGCPWIYKILHEDVT